MARKSKYDVGYKGVSSCGSSFEIIEFKGRGNVTIRFNNGRTKRTNTTHIKQGKVKDCQKGRVQIGDTFPCYNGDTVEVLEVIRTTKILVLWQNTGQTDYRKTESLRQGYNRPPISISPGDLYEMNTDGFVKVIKYNGAYDVDIEFVVSGWRTKATIQQLENGEVRDKMAPRTCGVGILGDTPTTDSSGETLKSYITWRNILVRCYTCNENKNPTYKNCTVCDEWLYYPHFKVWYDNNYIKGFVIDKDILQNGLVNKVYSSSTCCFIPQYVNGLLTFNQESDSGLSNGVCYTKDHKHYRARSALRNESEYLGTFSTEDEAFEVYKTHKEAVLYKVAIEEGEKGVIKAHVLEALKTFKVYPDKV